MLSIIGLSGSLRRASYNSAVLRAAAALMPPDSTLQIESIAGIPLYDADEEQASGVPAVVLRRSRKKLWFKLTALSRYQRRRHPSPHF